MKHFYVVEGTVRNNIGDILQGMAAAAFLKNNAIPVDRERLSLMNNQVRGFIISNGWFMHDFSFFPPPDNIKPLYISIHIANSALLQNEKIRFHFKENSPIGCRDRKTLQLFLGWGIPAYYSGCLTITTNPFIEIRNDDKGEYLIVDNIDHPIPEEIIKKIEKNHSKSFTRISHDPGHLEKSFPEYVRKGTESMSDLLRRYCDASLIITSKIHCALPCIGMGANVIFIHPNPSDPRLETVRKFIDIITYDQVLKSDFLRKQKQSTKKILANRKFLSQIVNTSVANEVNIIQKPKTIGQFGIKIKAVILARIYRSFIVFLLTTSLANSSIKRVFKKNNLRVS